MNIKPIISCKLMWLTCTTHTHIYTHAHTHMLSLSLAHTHTHTHRHTHTHTHTHTHRLKTKSDTCINTLIPFPNFPFKQPACRQSKQSQRQTTCWTPAVKMIITLCSTMTTAPVLVQPLYPEERAMMMVMHEHLATLRKRDVILLFTTRDENLATDDKTWISCDIDDMGWIHWNTS